MDIEWDETKNKSNIAKHGIDFCYASSIFHDLTRLDWKDNRFDYGEIRHITIGKIEELIYTVVYTIRNKRYRIISARGASRDERKAYQNDLKKGG